MKSVFFEVPGNPRGKARPRVVGKRNGKGVVTFTPDSTRDYEDVVKWAYVAKTRERFEGPIKVEIDAYFDYPRTLPKEMRGKWQQKKPDWDNIGKIVCDSLNGIAWKDDAEVADGRVTKTYEAGRPRVEVRITELSKDGT